MPGPLSGGARARRARGRRLLLLLALTGAVIAGAAGRPAAHGDANFVVGSTADGGGALTAPRSAADPITLGFSTVLAGFSIYTADLPAFDAAAADAPATPLFVLDDATAVTLTLAAPLDAGASVKVNGVALDGVGDAAPLGTFDAARPAAFHGDMVWTLTVPTGTAGDFALSFVLTAGAGYAPSALTTVTLRIPVATPTVIPPTPTPTVTPPPPEHLIDAAAAKAAVQCEAAFVKEAAKRAQARQRSLATCGSALYRCAQRSPGDDRCRDKAAATCAKALAKTDAGDAALAGRVERACAKLAAADLLAPAGVGHGALADVCADEAGVGLADRGTVATCVTRRGRCAVERGALVAQPRLADLLADGGITLAPESCVPAGAGAGEGIGDPAVVGKALVACDAAVQKAAGKLLAGRTTSVARCGHAIFACVQGAETARCLQKAGTLCQKEEARRAAAEAALAVAVGKRCADVPWTALADARGAGIPAAAGRCGALGVATLGSRDAWTSCLLRSVVCASETVAGGAVPRLAELLAAFGRPAGAAYCATP